MRESLGAVLSEIWQGRGSFVPAAVGSALLVKGAGASFDARGIG